MDQRLGCDTQLRSYSRSPLSGQPQPAEHLLQHRDAYPRGLLGHGVAEGVQRDLTAKADLQERVHQTIDVEVALAQRVVQLGRTQIRVGEVDVFYPLVED